MDSVSNYRELGNLPIDGGTIRPGVLFRSGHLAGLSDPDLGAFSAAGIRTVIDLRSDGDIEGEGADRVPDGVRHHRVPIHDDAGRGDDLRSIIMRGDIDELRSEMGDGRGHQTALDGAVSFVEHPDRVASFGEAITIAMNPDNWPLLWHCSAGKDRAGWVGTSLLLAAGTPTEVIVAHYLESNRATGTANLFPEGELKELIRPFLEVHEDYVRGQLSAVEERWGGVEGLFSEGFGIDTSAVDRFRRALRTVGD